MSDPRMAALHNHNEYSPLDGCCTTLEVCQRAKELNLAAVSTTEHGTLSSHREFQRSAKKIGIKPILGEELYYSETDRFDRRSNAKRQDGTSVYTHLIALAMNDKGLKNLQAMDREAWLAFYNKPRMDWEILEKYNEGIIFTSACMGGLLSKAIERGELEYAEEQARRFKDLLGDRYYIEIQGHNDIKLNYALLEIADKYSIKPIIAEDSHHAYPEQRELQEMFLIISTHPKQNFSADYEKARAMPLLERFNYLYPDRKMTFQDINLYIGGYDLRKRELLSQNIDREDVFENTLEIADRVEEYTYQQNLSTLPNIVDNVAEVLTERVWDGLKEKGLSDSVEHRARVEHELKVINDKGFGNYFLVLEDLMAWCREQKIRVGKGRGSGSSSLVNYSLGITGIDPLQYNLLFERFLEPERPDWPDVDVDIQDNRRQEAKDYLAKKYGYAAGINNINTNKGKKSLKDVAKVLGIPYKEINTAMKVLKGIDEISGHDVIKEFEQLAPEFCGKYPDLTKFARQMYGKIYGYGMHAAGIVIADKQITDYAPVETRKLTGTDIRVEVSALDKVECDDLGLIKIDLLGLKNLTVIEEALRLIRENKGRIIDIDKLPLTDPAVFETISEGHTVGVFQAEESASTKLVMDMKVNDFNDLVVSNALVRPGAWKAVGEDYIAAKHGKTDGQFIHEDVDFFMNTTFHYPIFQEQMMLLSIHLAGFTVAESNGLRKGIGKKKPEIIALYKDKFIDGASKKIDVKFAKKLWKSLEESGAYAFVLSHAVCYSIITYQTAWLKIHYPLEYMCALLSNESTSEALTDYLVEAKRLGITIRYPHINHSMERFSIEGDSLRMGLAGVKYISDVSARRIIANRPYENYAEFSRFVLQKGSGLNTRTLQALNKFGGAKFEDNPRCEDYKDNIYEFLGIPAFNNNLITSKIKEQLRNVADFVDDETFVSQGIVKQIKSGGEGNSLWTRVDIVDETGKEGIFAGKNIEVVKGKMYLFLIGNNSIMHAVDLQDVNSDDVVMDYLRRPILDEVDNDQFKVLAAYSRTTKKGDRMAFLTLADRNKGLQTVLVFDSMYQKVKAMVRIGSERRFRFGKTYDGALFVRDVL